MFSEVCPGYGLCFEGIGMGLTGRTVLSGYPVGEGLFLGVVDGYEHGIPDIGLGVNRCYHSDSA
jgi:hypothetical protein